MSDNADPPGVGQADPQRDGASPRLRALDEPLRIEQFDGLNHLGLVDLVAADAGPDVVEEHARHWLLAVVLVQPAQERLRGHVDWRLRGRCCRRRFTVDADLKLTEQARAVTNKQSTEATTAVGKWNDQAAGSVVDRNAPGQMSLPALK
ncbi:MAG: hypothetical protein ACRDRK_22885 [Pseudonocardia sp.]